MALTDSGFYLYDLASMQYLRLYNRCRHRFYIYHVEAELRNSN